MIWDDICMTISKDFIKSFDLEEFKSFNENIFGAKIRLTDTALVNIVIHYM